MCMYEDNFKKKTKNYIFITYIRYNLKLRGVYCKQRSKRNKSEIGAEKTCF